MMMFLYMAELNVHLSKWPNEINSQCWSLLLDQVPLCQDNVSLIQFLVYGVSSVPVEN